MTPEEFRKRFTIHHPDHFPPGVSARQEAVTFLFGGLAGKIDAMLPDSREKATALTHLETAMFWANAGIARNE